MIRTTVALAVSFALAIAAGASADEHAAGTLQVHAGFAMNWHQVACPAGTPSPSAFCTSGTGTGVVPGLGHVTELYTYVVDDYTAATTSVHLTATLTVAGKGEIDASATTPSPVCSCSIDHARLDFTISGGSGAYEGAQGSGALSDVERATSATKGWATDTWSGSLTVSGYTFDTTPPVIQGATPKTVTSPNGAKGTRVKYEVTAHDAAEGPVAPTCTPHSGSMFKVGRTIVHCTATDASGNSAHARFTITVRTA